MSLRFSIVACMFVLLAGCAPSGGGIGRGTPITQVQLEYGTPDVFSDVSGDEGRDYVPTNRPEEEWPWSAPRTFYYLDRDFAVTFVRGRVEHARPIDPGLREHVLVPLVQRNRAAPSDALR
jgi:hypothetical protein